MNRRELLKPLAALPFVPFIVGKDEVKAVEPSPGKFVIFVDGNSVELATFCHCLPGHPLAGTPVHAVFPIGDQTVEDVVKIYKVE